MTAALEISHLHKSYQNGFVALNDVSLKVEQGDFFALLGPNGAGKSTLIGILCSLTLKSSGQVSILGHNIDSHFPEAKQHIGVVPQEFNFSQFERVIDIVVTQAGFYGIKRQTAFVRAEHYLKKLGLWEKRFERARLLSGGMKRRLMIVRALIHEPALLVLDEPTAGVDIELRRSMWDFLREINARGTTIILTTHYLEEAENLCKNVAIINKGEIVQNTSVQALLTQLNQETFVFDFAAELAGNLQIEGVAVRQISALTLEVDVPKGKALNDIFLVFDHHNLKVSSMRTKTGRLEELFVHLLNEQD